MRITNKIIQNNSLKNINVNKTQQDTLSTQISTEKKLTRPSDDPIVALRSLRLRTSVNQTTQYVEKNVEDAKSWLDVTEDAIDTLSSIITDMRQQYTKGTSDTLTASDRTIIAENLEALAAEVYNTGNADFAGRSVFTGYRTETTLTFQKQETVKFSITEDETTATLDTTNYVHTGDEENDVYSTDITRIRLSYDDLDDANIELSLNGSTVATEKMALSDDPYAYVHDNPDKVVYVPETGEVLIGENVGTTDTITSFKVTYDKSKWENGDLRPQHYFNCVETDEDGGKITYSSHSQEISYNVGVNQSLRINTTADECFSHNIVRDLQDVLNAISEVEDIETTISDLTAQYNSYSESETSEREAVQVKIDAAKKAQTFLNEKLHNLFSANITAADEYLDDNDVALTNCGTRSKRLDLIENRLDTQLTTLKELKSENEDVDLAETAVKLSSATNCYDAALLATSKIIKESLLNYI